jgi:hypothetical protein
MRMCLIPSKWNLVVRIVRIMAKVLQRGTVINQQCANSYKIHLCRDSLILCSAQGPNQRRRKLTKDTKRNRREVVIHRGNQLKLSTISVLLKDTLWCLENGQA